MVAGDRSRVDAVAHHHDVAAGQHAALLALTGQIIPLNRQVTGVIRRRRGSGCRRRNRLSTTLRAGAIARAFSTPSATSFSVSAERTSST